MLREKYLRRNAGKDHTFQSVVLAGVYDVKSLKLKIREGVEIKYLIPKNTGLSRRFLQLIYKATIIKNGWIS